MTTLIRGAGFGRGVHRLQRPGVPATAEPAPPVVDAAVVPAEAAEPLQAVLARVEAERAAGRQAAQQELAAATEQATKEARAAGQAQGAADAAASAQGMLQQLDTLIEQLGQAFEAKLDGLEDLAVAIAFEAVVKVLGTALATPEGVRAAVAQALAATRQHEKLTVRLAPDDFRLLMQDANGAHSMARPGIELHPDEQVAPGGCIVDTGSGQLDARLHTQLHALQQVLLQARRARAAQGPV